MEKSGNVTSRVYNYKPEAFEEGAPEKSVLRTTLNNINLKSRGDNSFDDKKNILQTNTMLLEENYFKPVLLNDGSTGSGQKYTPQIDSTGEYFRFLAKDMSWIILAQSQAIKNMAEIQNSFLEILSNIFAGIHSLAQSQYEFMQTQDADAKDAAIKGTRTSGIVALLLGVVEILIGCAIIYFSSGAGAAIGAMLIVDGITKSLSSVAAIASPESFQKNNGTTQMLSQLMQSGVFAAFTVLGKNGPVIVQAIASIVMALVSCGTSLLATGAGIMANGYLLANAGVSSYGMISGIIDQFKEKDETKDSKEDSKDNGSGMKFSQAASGGILSCVMYAVLEKTPIAGLIKENWGESALIGIEMGLLFLSGIVGIALPKLLSKIPIKTPGSNISIKLTDFLSKKLSSLKLFQQLQKLILSITKNIPQMVSITNLRSASMSANSFSTVSQSSQGWVVFSKKLTERDLSLIKAFITLYGQTVTNMQKSLEQYATINQYNESMFPEIVNEMSKQLENFTLGLNQIIRNEFNRPTYARG